MDKFAGLQPFEWEAISALATGAATLVAIGLPFVLRHMDQQKERRRQDDDLKSVLQAMLEAFSIIFEMRQRFNNIIPPGPADPDASPFDRRARENLEFGAKKAAHHADVLLLLASRPGMSWEVISGCVELASGMVMVGQAVARHGELDGTEFQQAFASEVMAALDILGLGRTRLDEVAGAAGLVLNYQNRAMSFVSMYDT